MKKYVMIHDENLCIGCQACNVACRSENGVPAGHYRLQVHAKTSGKFPRLKTDFARHSCVMCLDAPCVSVCPTGASFKTVDGVTLVDEKLCVGCKYCVLACPYDARYMHPESGAPDKCTFCYPNRVSKGAQPACVSVCPTNALTFGDSNDPKSAVSILLAKKSIEYPKAHLGTHPALGFVKNKKGGSHD